MPKPRADESHDEFIERCMADAEARADFPDSEQRFAFCSSQWDHRKGGVMDDLHEELLREFEGYLDAIDRRLATAGSRVKNELLLELRPLVEEAKLLAVRANGGGVVGKEIVGAPGKDGRGIEDVEWKDGTLVVLFTDGTLREFGPLIGPAGERGPIGEKGERGERGEKGDLGVGERGPIGERGADGERGERGEMGAPGPRGERGEPGVHGEKGEPGERGEKGEPGAPGRDGVDGERGEPGVHGEKGEPGERGEKGEPGAPGRDGVDGERGEPGPEGRRGDRGERGERGEKGEVGERGRDGRDGIQPEQLKQLLAEAREEGEQRALASIHLVDGRVLVVGEKRFVFPVPIYRRTWQEGVEYQPGEFVTLGGSMWHCNLATTSRPKEGTEEWTLAVKQGRDRNRDR